MALDAPAGVTVLDTATIHRRQSSYVDWPAIIAGIVLASAISVVFISFGSAIGLNFLDFDAREGASPDLHRHCRRQLVPLGADFQLHGRRLSDRPPAPPLSRRHRRRKRSARRRPWPAGLGRCRGSGRRHRHWRYRRCGQCGRLCCLDRHPGGLQRRRGRASIPTPISSIPCSARPSRSMLPWPATKPAASSPRLLSVMARVSEEDRTYLANVVAANTGLTQEEADGPRRSGHRQCRSGPPAGLEAARIARNTGIIGAFLSPPRSWSRPSAPIGRLRRVAITATKARSSPKSSVASDSQERRKTPCFVVWVFGCWACRSG